MTALTARRVRRADEQGAVAIVVALTLTVLLVASAMVLDFGLVRVDRQVNKSAADAATVAGLQGLIGSDNKSHPYRGVCNAIRYLQQNDARFATVSDTSGTWTGGNGCTNVTLRSQACVPGNPASWAKFTWNGIWQGEALQVVIQSGYQLAGSGWSEETLPAVLADNDDEAQGCDQLAVTVTQNRKPGLGSLATSSDLVSSIRSVGRIRQGPGGDAPAMILLKRTGCPVLSTGSSGGGSFIHVFGAISSNGRTQPGSIHADADGQGCSTSLFEGKAANGIVAYAAPLASNPTQPDPSKPGRFTSVAGDNGVGIGIIRDNQAYVYASAALNESLAGSAAKTEPTARPLVTRKPVDDRYLAGVTAAVNDAQNSVFASINAGNAAANGYTVVGNCNPSTVPSASKLFIDCTDNNGYKGTALINAQTVVFNGRINPSAQVSMPNATKVYIFGISGRPAIELSGTAKLSVHTTGNLSAGLCSNAITPTPNKAALFVREGGLKQTGGLLQLCNTTVFMMGGQPGGCLPTVGYTTVPAPTSQPCIPSSGPAVSGTGQLSQNGGSIDWTAPNQNDLMTLPNGDPDPVLAPSWSDPNGPEDLAFWSESSGTSSDTYSMNGGSGFLHTVGVFMVPNADPFSIGGNAAQDLTNAQYIATSIALNGNTTNIKMRVDPNSAVTLRKQRLVGLVR